MPPKVERGGEILTFARLRPVVESTPSRRVAYKIKRGSGSTRGYAAAEGDDAQKDALQLSIPEEYRSAVGNKGVASFNFSKVFQEDVTQEDVFRATTQDMVTACLDGFSGAVFVYGQTNSGKTWTMTGGESFEERGLAPRAIGQLFRQIRDEEEGGVLVRYEVRASYLEVYEERVYDLLDVSNRDKSTEERAVISLLADGEGNQVLKGLTTFDVDNEEETMNLFFMGNSHRITGETPANAASSRSHAVFTLAISSEREGEEIEGGYSTSREYHDSLRPDGYEEDGDSHGRNRDELKTIVRRSEFNLVDLAGCERMYKRDGFGYSAGLDDNAALALRTAGAADATPTNEAHDIRKSAREQEGKSINSSLHKLEKVMLALKNPGTHIPYRDSPLTAILRKSLGGRCRTVFVVTLSPDVEDLGETVASCRFAQSCRKVICRPVADERLDPEQEVRLLRREAADMKSSLMAKDDLLQVLTGEIRDKDGDLDEARQRLEARDDHLLMLTDEMRERLEDLQEAQRRLEVKDERMKNLINNIRGKDNDLETAHNELEEMRAACAFHTTRTLTEEDADACSLVAQALADDSTDAEEVLEELDRVSAVQCCRELRELLLASSHPSPPVSARLRASVSTDSSLRVQPEHTSIHRSKDFTAEPEASDDEERSEGGQRQSKEDRAQIKQLLAVTLDENAGLLVELQRLQERLDACQALPEQTLQAETLSGESPASQENQPQHLDQDQLRQSEECQEHQPHQQHQQHQEDSQARCTENINHAVGATFHSVVENRAAVASFAAAAQNVVPAPEIIADDVASAVGLRDSETQPSVRTNLSGPDYFLDVTTESQVPNVKCDTSGVGSCFSSGSCGGIGRERPSCGQYHHEDDTLTARTTGNTVRDVVGNECVNSDGSRKSDPIARHIIGVVEERADETADGAKVMSGKDPISGEETNDGLGEMNVGHAMAGNRAKELPKLASHPPQDSTGRSNDTQEVRELDAFQGHAGQERRSHESDEIISVPNCLGRTASTDRECGDTADDVHDYHEQKRRENLLGNISERYQVGTRVDPWKTEERRGVDLKSGHEAVAIERCDKVEEATTPTSPTAAQDTLSTLNYACNDQGIQGQHRPQMTRELALRRLDPTGSHGRDKVTSERCGSGGARNRPPPLLFVVDDANSEDDLLEPEPPDATRRYPNRLECHGDGSMKEEDYIYGSAGGDPGQMPLEDTSHLHGIDMGGFVKRRQQHTLLTGGGLFMTSGKIDNTRCLRTPRMRFVWMSPDLDTIMWRDCGPKKATGSAEATVFDLVRLGLDTSRRKSTKRLFAKSSTSATLSSGVEGGKMKDTVGTIDNGGTSTTGTYFSQEAGVGGATWNPLVHTAGLDDDDAREILLAAGGGRKQRLVLELDGGTLDPGAERRQRNKWFEAFRYAVNRANTRLVNTMLRSSIGVPLDASIKSAEERASPESGARTSQTVIGTKTDADSLARPAGWTATATRRSISGTFTKRTSMTTTSEALDVTSPGSRSQPCCTLKSPLPRPSVNTSRRRSSGSNWSGGGSSRRTSIVPDAVGAGQRKKSDADQSMRNQQLPVSRTHRGEGSFADDAGRTNSTAFVGDRGATTNSTFVRPPAIDTDKIFEAFGPLSPPAKGEAAALFSCPQVLITANVDKEKMADGSAHDDNNHHVGYGSKSKKVAKALAVEAVAVVVKKRNASNTTRVLTSSPYARGCVSREASPLNVGAGIGDESSALRSLPDDAQFKVAETKERRARGDSSGYGIGGAGARDGGTSGIRWATSEAFITPLQSGDRDEDVEGTEGVMNASDGDPGGAECGRCANSGNEPVGTLPYGDAPPTNLITRTSIEISESGEGGSDGNEEDISGDRRQANGVPGCVRWVGGGTSLIKSRFNAVPSGSCRVDSQPNLHDSFTADSMLPICRDNDVVGIDGGGGRSAQGGVGDDRDHYNRTVDDKVLSCIDTTPARLSSTSIVENKLTLNGAKSREARQQQSQDMVGASWPKRVLTRAPAQRFSALKSTGEDIRRRMSGQETRTVRATASTSSADGETRTMTAPRTTGSPSAKGNGPPPPPSQQQMRRMSAAPLNEKQYLQGDPPLLRGDSRGASSPSQVMMAAATDAPPTGGSAARRGSIQQLGTWIASGASSIVPAFPSSPRAKDIGPISGGGIVGGFISSAAARSVPVALSADALGHADPAVVRDVRTSLGEVPDIAAGTTSLFTFKDAKYSPASAIGSPRARGDVPVT